MCFLRRHGRSQPVRFTSAKFAVKETRKSRAGHRQIRPSLRSLGMASRRTSLPSTNGFQRLTGIRSLDGENCPCSVVESPDANGPSVLEVCLHHVQDPRRPPVVVVNVEAVSRHAPTTPSSITQPSSRQHHTVAQPSSLKLVSSVGDMAIHEIQAGPCPPLDLPSVGGGQKCDRLARCLAFR